MPTINAAAEAAGRPAPRVIAALPVCVTDDVAAAHERAAEVFAVYGQLPSYRAMLDREGAAGAADIAIVGSAAEVVDRIGALADIGVTDFAAVEFGGDPDEAAATERPDARSVRRRRAGSSHRQTVSSDQPTATGVALGLGGGPARRSRCPCRRRR